VRRVLPRTNDPIAAAVLNAGSGPVVRMDWPRA
jgi:hypothetical protein